MKLSVIVPTLDEEAVLAACLRSARGADEVIVIDGGSADATQAVARKAGTRVLTSPRGRGEQLNRGASIASGDVLLFLHADTILPEGFRREVAELIESGRADWGRFDVRFDAGGPLIHLIARLISLRSRATRVATGDQAIFVTRDLFERCGGFPEAPLFEDVALCRRLKRNGQMGIPDACVITSARRWRRGGSIRTSLLMWGLKLLYLAGVEPARLVRLYRDVR